MMKKKILPLFSILVVSLMILGSIVPVSAWSYRKPKAIVVALGRFTSVLPATEGDRCRFLVNARLLEISSTTATTEEWVASGRGVFVDRDYTDGRLVAILNVDSATTHLSYPDQVIIEGDAKVYIGGSLVGVYRFNMVIYPPRTYVTCQIPELNFLAYTYDTGFTWTTGVVIHYWTY